MRLVNGTSQAEHKAIAQWVGERIPFVGSAGFGNCKCIAILSNKGNMAAGVVFHDWQPEFQTIAFSIAADSPIWTAPPIVRALLSYPFEQLGVNKLWTATPIQNDRAWKLAKVLKFTREATLRHHFGHKKHAVINSMMRDEYQQFYGDKHGQTVSANAA